VSQVKLIAEPWDVGPGGYQVGNFPPLWTEWNGRYRDAVRDFWRGAPATLGEFASRLAGSADLYESSGRRPVASVNFVTAHDGFTLRDLVSYNEKHNEANGEGNADGEAFNRSWNCGVEGDTDDEAVLALRARQQRNMIATLMLSQGVPMLLHGDELGRSQGGNNNAYCQDSELTWVRWDSADLPLVAFTAEASRIRREHPVFRRNRFFHGRPVERGAGDPLPDVVWLNPDASPMLPANWDEELARAIAVFYNGAGIGKDPWGRPIVDASFLLCFNSNAHAVAFALPPEEYSREWELVLDTAGALASGSRRAAGDRIDVVDKSLVILRAFTAPSRQPDYSAAASLALLRAVRSGQSGRPGGAQAWGQVPAERPEPAPSRPTTARRPRRQ
jgi:glycogen operon protein